MKRRRLKKNVIFVCETVICFALVLISLIFITPNINFNKEPERLISTVGKGNVDYKVVLKENEYFSENELDENGQYIASIIDKLKLDLKYTFNSDKKFDYTYKYKVIGTLSVAHKIDTNTTKTVWVKEYPLVEEKTKELNNSNNFGIEEKVDIDYGKFNSYVNEFKKDYVLAIQSNLNVKLIVDITGKYDGYDKEINFKYEESADIPLSEQTINININTDENTENNVVMDENVKIIKNVPLFIGLLLTFLLSIGNIIRIAVVVFKDEQKDKKYQKKLHKILNSYDEIIVQAKNNIDLSDLQIINVASFDELLDAQEELRVPIVYTEIYPNEENRFVLIHDKQAWLYIFRNEHDE